MVRIHVGQPFDSGRAALSLRSWQAIRSAAGVECPELVEGLSSDSRTPMFGEISCPDPVDNCAFVYILESADGAFYVGQSYNVRERLRKHRVGIGSKHTQDHPFVPLVYVEGPLLPSDAIRRERLLKRWSRAKKAALVTGDIVALKQLSSRKRQ